MIKHSKVNTTTGFTCATTEPVEVELDFEVESLAAAELIHSEAYTTTTASLVPAKMKLTVVTVTPAASGNIQLSAAGKVKLVSETLTISPDDFFALDVVERGSVVKP